MRETGGAHEDPRRGPKATGRVETRGGWGPRMMKEHPSREVSTHAHHGRRVARRAAKRCARHDIRACGTTTPGGETHPPHRSPRATVAGGSEKPLAATVRQHETMGVRLQRGKAQESHERHPAGHGAVTPRTHEWSKASRPADGNAPAARRGGKGRRRRRASCSGGERSGGHRIGGNAPATHDRSTVDDAKAETR